MWLDFDSGASPDGQKGGVLDVRGTSYELWRDDNHGDRGDGKGWTYYTAKGPKLGLQGLLPIDAVLNAMADKGYWDRSLYVSSVEFGNEVRSGTGSTWVKRYQVDVEATVAAP